jgi:hypothetical protein
MREPLPVDRVILEEVQDLRGFREIDRRIEQFEDGPAAALNPLAAGVYLHSLTYLSHTGGLEHAPSFYLYHT